jgi:tripartite-type tricarboxylate transporter receptor subunit TctC
MPLPEELQAFKAAPPVWRGQFPRACEKMSIELPASRSLFYSTRLHLPSLLVAATADQMQKRTANDKSCEGTSMKPFGVSKLYVASAFAAAFAAALPAAADWKPTRPINLIVPWAPGGSTDQVTRLTAAQLEPLLGQTIVIVNQPGASGALGTRSALDAAKDGYTWTAGAAQDLGVYETLGLLKTRYTDWHIFTNVANIQVLSVGEKSPYKSAKQLLDAMQANPGRISVGTAGVTSTGHNAMDAISKKTGVKYRHVSYDGGAPAVVSTVAGETEVTTQSAVEQADMIRGKRLHPLAVIGDKPLEIEGYGTIPPLSEVVPGFTAPANYFGIFIPKGVPEEVIQTLEKIWTTTIKDNEALKKYAFARGALFLPLTGDAAQKAVFPAIQANAWQMADGNKAKVSPDTVGIPKP